MTESPEELGRVFISYRRDETAPQAGRLYDRLSDRFGEEQIFMDVDSIRLGVDFTEAITTAVSQCDALIALIGQRWLTVVNTQGQRRIDDPDDYVRLEIEAAIQRNIRIIPVLVDGAPMPRAEDLPPSLQPLGRRQALELSNERFRSDALRLLHDLEEILPSRPIQEGTAALQPVRPETWRVELVEKDTVKVALRVLLDRESHIITLEIVQLGMIEEIAVDGRSLIRKRTIKGVHELPLSNGSMTLRLTLTVGKSRIGLLKTVALRLNDQLIYEG